mgnify:CR=1 FL=1
MAKKVKAIIKIQASGGAATPAPPLGPVMGQHGVNIQQFVQQFNAATQDRRGEVVPAIVTIYEDRSFEFLLKTAPASDMIKKAVGIERGSGKPNTEKKESDHSGKDCIKHRLKQRALLLIQDSWLVKSKMHQNYYLRKK